MKVLAGDIGGTNSRLAVFEVQGAGYRMLASERYSSAAYSSLEAIVEEFLREHPIDCVRACFGVAGPVIGDRVETTNLRWTVRARNLEEVANVESAWLLNDLQAQAYGIPALGPNDFVVLNPGHPEAVGNAALIAAGTGLGQAGMFWDGESHTPFASEGGHASFAPRSELEIALLGYLSEKFGHVSWERVLSGPGFVNIHDFLIDYRHVDGSSRHVLAMRKEDPSAITQAARDGSCELCVEAMDMFAGFYGAEAGNVALKFLARGGVYIGGGIAPKIVEFLRRPVFLESFLEKGRMRDVLEGVPVRVIVRKGVALLGAANYAARVAGQDAPVR